MTKPFQAGRAAENGVVAALSAQRGWTGEQNILEAPLGFFHVFCGPDNYEGEKVINQIGRPFDMEHPGIILKKYCSCAFTHPVIDAALSITQSPQYHPEEVDRVEGHIHKLADQILIHRHPQTGLEAKFSAEGCLALAFVDGDINIKSFTDHRVRSKEVKEMMTRINREILSEEKREGPPEFGPAEVKVFLKGGKTLEARVDKAKGTPENPMSPEEIQEKYIDCCTGILPEEGIEKSISMVQNLDTLERISDLMESYRVAR
jgi:2-methylcitrate dehydratase PrpD